jgi:hypothetical protein
VLASALEKKQILEFIRRYTRYKLDFWENVLYSGNAYFYGGINNLTGIFKLEKIIGRGAHKQQAKKFPIPAAIKKIT